MSMPTVPVEVSALCECLRDLVEWQIFAQYLPGIGQADINIILKDKRDDLNEQKRALYGKWLQVYPNASWDDVVKALENPVVKKNNIAKQLRKKYLIESTNTNFTSSDHAVISPAQSDTSTLVLEEVGVKENIVTELDSLKRSFIDLTQNVKSEVKQKMKIDNTIISDIVFRVQQDQPPGSIPSLSSVQTTDELFTAIRPRYNFLNCYLIVSIALFLCGLIAEKATTYDERIKRFMRSTKIKYLKNTLKPYYQRFQACDNTTKVIIVVENWWGDQPLELVRNLIEILFPIKHPDQLQWYEIDSGSVIMTFIALEHMTSSLIESSRKKTEFMRLIGVISLKIGDELVWQKEDEDAVLSFEKRDLIWEMNQSKLSVTEKIEVLSLLSKTNIGIGETETADSGVIMDTRHTIDALDKTKTEEESGPIQLDYGVRISQHPLPIHNHPPAQCDITPDPHGSVTFSLAQLSKEGLFSQKEGQVPAPKVLAKSKDGRFWKYNYIDSGSFKEVYRGWDNVEKRCIAWCEMKLDGGEPDAKQKVMEEIKMLRRINNPHVLQLFDFWEHTEESGRKTMVLATELMTGGTLKQYGKCPSVVIRNWGRQILKGLDALHTHQPPILHRDLKCTNIFLDKASGTVKIGDLGLATLKSSTSRTKSNKGTPMCKAPEVSDGHYNEQVDVYSFGMCLLELGTGKYPYKEYTNEGQLLKAVLNDKKLPKVLESITDSTLKGVITGCIKFDPRERYTVKQLLSHEFFLINEEDTQETHSDDKTALVKIQNGSNDTICYGIGEVEPDSGVVMDTRYSTDSSDKTTTEEVKLDDGAQVNQQPGAIHTKHSTMDATNKTEEGLGPIQLDDGARVNQQPPPQQFPTPNNVKPIGPNKSMTFDSVQPSTLKDESSLVTLKATAEASASFVTRDNSASKGVHIKPNKEYDCWRKNISDVFNLLGEANFPSAAGLLYEKSLISSELYDNIVTPRPGLSEREQITLLFNIIERKLQDTDREFVKTTWKAFTNAVVKTDSRYKEIKANLESLVNEQLKSELEAFRSNKERLCRLLQASVLRLANLLWSDSVITDDEKSQVVNETFHYYQKLMHSIQDEIGKRIKEDPTVFYTVVETLNRVDGLKKAVKKYLTLQASSSISSATRPSTSSEAESVLLTKQQDQRSIQLKTVAESRSMEGNVISAHILDPGDHNEVYCMVEPLKYQWAELGMKLGVSYAEIEAIDDEISTNRKLMKILSVWLRRRWKDQLPIPTWRILHDAVEPLDRNIADAIARDHSCSCHGCVGIMPEAESVLLTKQQDQRSIQLKTVAESRSMEGNVISAHRILDPGDHNEVYCMVEPLKYQWAELGMKLGVSYAEIEAIDDEISTNSRKLMKILSVWLRGRKNQPIPSWRILHDAVEPLDRNIADAIARDHSCSCHDCVGIKPGVPKMSRPTERELDTALKDLVRWERFAHHLPGIESTHIQIIKANNPGDIVGQKLALFNKWLTAYSSASWRDIVSALQTAEGNMIAKEIESEYIRNPNRSSTASRDPDPNPMVPLVNCISGVLRKNFAILRSTTAGTLPDFAAKLYSAGILADGIHRDPSYDKISSSFMEGLQYCTTEKEVAMHCQKFFSAFYSLGGPLKLAADKIKRNITESVRVNLNGKEFVIPQY